MSEKSVIADIFNCACNSARVQEVRVGAVVMTEVIAIDCIGRADYGAEVAVGGHIDHYCCAECGKTIGRNELLALVKLHDSPNQEG